MSSVISGFQGLPAFCHVYNVSFIDPAQGANFTFDSNNVLNGFTHTAGSDTITSQVDGVFYVTWYFSTQNGCKVSFLQNDIHIEPLSFVTIVQSNSPVYGHGIITVSIGDTFKIRNDGPADAFLSDAATYSNAAIIFMQIGNHA